MESGDSGGEQNIEVKPAQYNEKHNIDVKTKVWQ